MSIADYISDLDAVSQADLVRSKEIKPTELVVMAIERIERLNPKINAVIHAMYDQALVAAQAWEAEIMANTIENVLFCGVPFLLKDLGLSLIGQALCLEDQ